MRPLVRHTVEWYDCSDQRQNVQRTVYFSPTHHEDRTKAADRNEHAAVNRIDYDDACAMGKAIIVNHVRETDGEA